MVPANQYRTLKKSLEALQKFKEEHQLQQQQQLIPTTKATEEKETREKEANFQATTEPINSQWQQDLNPESEIRQEIDLTAESPAETLVPSANVAQTLSDDVAPSASQELCSFLPAEKVNSASQFLEQITGIPCIDVKNGCLSFKGKKIGHLAFVLNWLFGNKRDRPYNLSNHSQFGRWLLDTGLAKDTHLTKRKARSDKLRQSQTLSAALLKTLPP